MAPKGGEVKAVQLSRFDPDRLDCRKIKALYVGASGWVIVQAWTLQETFLVAMFAVHRTGLCFPGWVEIEVEKERKKEEKKKSAHCSTASLQIFPGFRSQGNSSLFIVKPPKYTRETI